MGMTVVGLFEQASEAQAAMQELVKNHYASNDIDVKSHTASERAGDMSDLMKELTSDGVPAAEAQLYVNGVKSGDTIEILRTSDDKAEAALAIMNRYGALDIHDAHLVRTQTTTSTMATGMAAGAATAAVTTPNVTIPTVAPAAQTVNAQGEQTLNVVEEELAVGKRQIQRGGVRVYSRVTETPVEASVNLREEHVTVERHAVNRPVDTATMTGLQDRVIEVTTTEEVPVVAKEARIVEEVVVGKEATERTETIHDTVRRTDVEVEQIAGQTTTTGTTVTGTTTTGTGATKL